MLNPHLKPPCSDCRGLGEATTLPPETQDSRNSQSPHCQVLHFPGPSLHVHRKLSRAPLLHGGHLSGQGDHTHPRKARKISYLPFEPQAKREHDGALKDPAPPLERLNFPKSKNHLKRNRKSTEITCKHCFDNVPEEFITFSGETRAVKSIQCHDIRN